MNIEYLNNFITLVDFNNFTKAANFLHIAQSTLSKQITCLEEEFHVKLITRTNRFVGITPAGEYLYEHGKDLIAQSEDIARRMLSFAQLEDGAFSVSSITVDCSGLFQAINKFREAYPSIAFYIEHDLLSTVLKKILTGESDVGILANYSIMGSRSASSDVLKGLKQIKLKREPFYLLVPTATAPAFGNTVDLTALSKDHIVLIEGSLRQYLFHSSECADVLSNLNLRPMGADYADWESAVLQIKSGLSWAIVPRPLSHDGCTPIPISTHGFYYDIYALWKDDSQNPLLPIFVKYLEDCI